MKKVSFDEYYKKLVIIFASLFIGMCAFCAYATFLHQKPEVPQSSNELFQYLVPIFCVSGIAIGIYMRKAKKREIEIEQTEEKRRELVVSTFIIQWALIEGPVLFTLVIYLITGNDYFLYIALAMLAYYLSLYPNKRKVQAIVQSMY